MRADEIPGRLLQLVAEFITDMNELGLGDILAAVRVPVNIVHAVEVAVLMLFGEGFQFLELFGRQIINGDANGIAH